VRRYRSNIGKPPKERKRIIFMVSLVIVLLIIFFVPGPNGLVKVLYKTYKKQRLHNEIEQLKIKAELIEAKIAKGQNEEYLRKYLKDNYQMVPKDSVK
jgi:cell division protein FtsB